MELIWSCTLIHSYILHNYAVCTYTARLFKIRKMQKPCLLASLGWFRYSANKGDLLIWALASAFPTSRLETLSRWVHMVQACQLGKRQWSLWRKAKTCLPASSAWDKISRWQGSKLANLQMCHVNSHNHTWLSVFPFGESIQTVNLKVPKPQASLRCNQTVSRSTTMLHLRSTSCRDIAACD